MLIKRFAMLITLLTILTGRCPTADQTFRDVDYTYRNVGRVSHHAGYAFRDVD